MNLTTKKKERTAKAVNTPEVKERFESLGATPIEMLSPDAFGAYVKVERERWGKAFRASGLPQQ